MSEDSWFFHNPVPVTFSPGAISDLSAHLHCRRAVLVTTRGFKVRGLVDQIQSLMGERLVGVLDDVKPNPDLPDLDEQGHRLRTHEPDMLIALGGGSSMDTAKGLARLVVQPEGRTLAGHFRDGEPFEHRPALPWAAIPTTSGTGSEVTPFGTVWDFEKDKKYSVTGTDLYAAYAVLDPELTVTQPLEITIYSGLDAVSHALESTWNKNASPVTLGFCVKSLQLALESLPTLKANPKSLEARGRMMQASLLAGLAISQTRTALAHSISYPLTTAFDLPHGFACSFTLPALMRFNAGADDGRLKHLARCLGYDHAEGLADALEALFETLMVPNYLSGYLPEQDSIMALANQMLTPGRADNNLRAAGRSDVEAILKESLDSLGFR
ncbi:MAG: iron-containing alcohol dehydrogenase family protein [Planctomycetota bacterium]|nr:MAG: iron-containing alcohol dehydrogenase family protein [Planctomycetota bacterium]